MKSIARVDRDGNDKPVDPVILKKVRIVPDQAAAASGTFGDWHDIEIIHASPHLSPSMMLRAKLGHPGSSQTTEYLLKE